MAFLQKGCYKWQPNKSLGLDVVNLIIFISKNGEKKTLKSQFFSLEKKKTEKKKLPKLENLTTKKNTGCNGRTT